MSLSQIFKKVLIPCAAGVTAENHTFGPNCVKKGENGTKPSELPIYSKKCAICGETTPSTPPPSPVEETVGNIRKELWVWQDSLRGYRHKIVEVYRKGFSKADSVVDYLREETHAPQRVGAIAVSGAAGYILALRRGMFRRIFYGCCGALGMAAICYPTETMDYLETVVLEGRKGFIVAYHFIYGEPPDPCSEMEEQPPAEKPKTRDCLCSPDPNNPKPCVLECEGSPTGFGERSLAS